MDVQIRLREKNEQLFRWTLLCWRHYRTSFLIPVIPLLLLFSLSSHSFSVSCSPLILSFPPSLSLLYLSSVLTHSSPSELSSFPSSSPPFLLHCFPIFISYTHFPSLPCFFSPSSPFCLPSLLTYSPIGFQDVRCLSDRMKDEMQAVTLISDGAVVLQMNVDIYRSQVSQHVIDTLIKEAKIPR